MKLNKIESKLLIYLNQIRPGLRYTQFIAAKWNMDYSHTARVLRMMTEKHLLTKSSAPDQNRKYYWLTPRGNDFLKEAQRVLEDKDVREPRATKEERTEKFQDKEIKKSSGIRTNVKKRRK